jgi:hypothetical protein
MPGNGHCDDGGQCHAGTEEHGAATPDDDGVATALAGFEAVFATDLLLALDRPFVHRVRMVTGKDTDPLNEVELLVDSLMTNGGALEAGRPPGRRTVVAFIP